MVNHGRRVNPPIYPTTRPTNPTTKNDSPVMRVSALESLLRKMSPIRMNVIPKQTIAPPQTMSERASSLIFEAEIACCQKVAQVYVVKNEVNEAITARGPSCSAPRKLRRYKARRKKNAGA